MDRIIKKGLLLATCMVAAGCSTSPQKLIPGEDSYAPLAFYEYKGERIEHKEQIKPVDINILKSVQKKAIENHTYVSEKEDSWNISLVGDCEDYALYVHRELAKQEIYSNLVLVKTSRRENSWHLVNEVDGWILDNRYYYIQQSHMLGYEWLRIGNFKDGWKEVSLAK